MRIPLPRLYLPDDISAPERSLPLRAFLRAIRLTFYACIGMAVFLHVIALVALALGDSHTNAPPTSSVTKVRFGSIAARPRKVNDFSRYRQHAPVPATAPAAPTASPIPAAENTPSQHAHSYKQEDDTPKEKEKENTLPGISFLESALQAVVSPGKPLPDNTPTPTTRPPSLAEDYPHGDATENTEGNPLGNELASMELIIRDYDQLISEWVKRQQRFPEEARRKGLTGRGVIRVKLNRLGQTQGMRVIVSTGHDLLDETMRDMVEAADPFPPMPDAYSADFHYADIPISFGYAS
ncbi:MAG: energy transducer TonB [Hyphomicrobiales bacterium]|nr:energy transducer TonB [Rickettsiales bacterium]MCP5361098.1 energy transducer TonB [Hyphomicrobiales bacterium]